MTEVSSAAIVNVDENCNSVNSVGVPFPKTNVKVVNPGTIKELKYNEIGELLISSPAIFKGYLDNSNASSGYGYYLVLKITYSLDSRGSNFIQEIEASPYELYNRTVRSSS